MYILYSLLLFSGLLVTLPWWILQMARSGKYRDGLAGRLGVVPERLKSAARPGCIWVHAVSVGEVLAVTNLIRELQSTYAESGVFVSTVTQTGQYLARERFGENKAFFLPLDLGFAVRAYLNLLRPRLLVLAETEFWPNLIQMAKTHGATIVAVNVRISDRSFPRYRRFRWFFSRVLAGVDLFLAQSAEDAQRLVAIGAPADRVRTYGNLKFDVRIEASSPIVDDLRRCLTQGSPVIVCGSTVEGEEETLLRAFQACLQRFPASVMMIAPRHPQRFPKVLRLIESTRLPPVQRSAWNSSSNLEGCVFLLDSIGELSSIYALADLAFVGGSLVPNGGHNILEPAQHGVAIMTGPHTFNFREIVRIFAQNDALRIVTEDIIAPEMVRLLGHREELERLGNNAKELFAEHAGTTRKTLEALQSLIQGDVDSIQ